MFAICLVVVALAKRMQLTRDKASPNSDPKIIAD